MINLTYNKKLNKFCIFYNAKQFLFEVPLFVYDFKIMSFATMYAMLILRVLARIGLVKPYKYFF